MNKLRTFIIKVPEFMSGFLILAITLVVFFELLVRELFKYSVFGITSELTRILIVWLSLVGAAVGVKRGTHFVFPIVAQRLGSQAALYLSILSTFMIMAFAFILIIPGLKVTIISARESFISIPVSIAWENIAFPVSGVLILTYSFLKMWEDFKILQRGEGIQRKTH
jgi:TRAP-type C4-dicarboxylate transport system permease small subunit